jgi:predicted nicotinamide N-methyase
MMSDEPRLQPPASAYDGPVSVSVLEFAGRSIRLVRPADPDRLLEAPDVLAWNERDDYMPYWAYLWPGAFLLAEAVARAPWPPGLRALEIGCGLGLAGLVGVAAGLRVHFTDYDETPLRFVARSAAENGFDPASFSTGRLDWRDLPDERHPVILGADVLYERRLVPLVVGVVDRMLEPDGVALVAGPDRVATEDLEPALAAQGLRGEARPLTARNEAGESVRGTLYRIWKKR